MAMQKVVDKHVISVHVNADGVKVTMCSPGPEKGKIKQQKCKSNGFNWAVYECHGGHARPAPQMQSARNAQLTGKKAAIVAKVSAHLELVEDIKRDEQVLSRDLGAMSV